MSAGGRKYPQRPPATSVARDTRQLVHFQVVSFLWRHRDALQLVLAALLLGALVALLVGAWWLW